MSLVSDQLEPFQISVHKKQAGDAPPPPMRKEFDVPKEPPCLLGDPNVIISEISDQFDPFH
jgi:hypothetical protein